MQFVVHPLQSMQQEYSHYEGILGILGSIQVRDHDHLLGLIGQDQERVSNIERRLNDAGTELAKLPSSGVIEDEEDDGGAFAAVHRVKSIYDALNNEIRSFRNSSAGFKENLSLSLKQETGILYNELLSFSYELQEYLRDNASLRDASDNDSTIASRSDISASAEALAQLAMIVYDTESLVKKRERLGGANEPLDKAYFRIREITKAGDLAVVRSRADDPVVAPFWTSFQSQQQASQPQTTNKDLWNVTAIRLNLRNGASDRGDVIAKLSQGDEVEVLEKNGNWYRVNSQQGEGWVFARYLARVRTQEP